MAKLSSSKHSSGFQGFFLNVSGKGLRQSAESRRPLPPAAATVSHPEKRLLKASDLVQPLLFVKLHLRGKQRKTAKASSTGGQHPVEAPSGQLAKKRWWASEDWISARSHRPVYAFDSQGSGLRRSAIFKTHNSTSNRHLLIHYKHSSFITKRWYSQILLSQFSIVSNGQGIMASLWCFCVCVWHGTVKTI